MCQDCRYLEELICVVGRVSAPLCSEGEIRFFMIGSVEFGFVNNAPMTAVTLGYIAVFVAAAVGGHLLVRRLVPHEYLRQHNDVAGFIIAVVGCMYAVLIAFVVIAVWEKFDHAGTNSNQEVNAVADMYQTSLFLPHGAREALLRDLALYSRLMVKEEWPAMQFGGRSQAAEACSERIMRSIYGFVPANNAQSQLHASQIVTVHKFLDARRERLEDNAAGLPEVLWLTLRIGAFATIAFTYLFGVERFRAQVVMTALLACLIGTMFSLIAQLEYPYRGTTSIAATDWQKLDTRLQREN